MVKVIRFLKCVTCKDVDSITFPVLLATGILRLILFLPLLIFGLF